MYKYYQTSEKSSWKAIPDSPDVEAKAVTAGAKKVTILAVSEIVDDERTERETLSYKGPWYADIDSKDLNEAILSARELINKLQSFDVPSEAIQVFASGGKGFHVIVPASVFSSGRQQRSLPAIYKEMALDLHVIGMDFQVYSGGRGVCWRLPNIERDNGRYRVPVTIEEVFNMTVDDYVSVTSRPRILPTPSVNGLFAPGMAALMEEAKRKVKLKPPPAKPVPKEELKQFADQPPQCINHLAEYKVRDAVNFNEAGFQMAIFVARAGADDRLKASLLSRMADNGHSTAYSSARQRVGHLQGLVSYISTVKGKDFSCAAMRGLLKNSPCEGCPLNKGPTDLDELTLMEEVGIEERADGYYVLGVKSDKKISTFSLKGTDVYLETSQDGDIVRRVGIKVDVLRDGQVLDSHLMSEGCWTSRLRFKTELEGLRNVAFFGNDDDVQKLKYLVCNESEDMNEIIQVYSAGIHLHKVAGRLLRVYVEPGFSINQIRMRGTHELAGTVSNAPDLQSVKLPDKGDDRLNGVVHNLFRVNAPKTVAQLLGWFCSCHLKTHFMHRYAQFPLVNLWGNAGSGKSMTSTLFSNLCGCDYTALGKGPRTLPSITQWALLDECSTTTTVPRILEEFNKSKMVPKMYDFCAEVMKASWNGLTIARGRLARSSVNGKSRTGAEVVNMAITSPLLVVSEQPLQMPALQQRCIQVSLSHADRSGKDLNFDSAFEHRHILHGLALALMVRALNTSEEWLETRMKHWEPHVPFTLIDRPRYSYKVLLVGLDLLHNVLTELEVPCADEVPELQNELLLSLGTTAEHLSAERHRTEVDHVIETLGIMASLTDSNGANWLREGVNYLKKDGYLFLDVPLVHAMYKVYQRSIGDRAVMETPTQFLELLRQESYFVTDKALVQGLGMSRYLVKLDMEKMTNKGLLVNLF